MKRKLNKRLLSAVLAAVMLITAVPLYAVNNSAPGRLMCS